MINPPIDKLVEKIGCKFALVCLVSKRAHFVEGKRKDEHEKSGDTILTYVSKEIYDGKVEPLYED